MTLAQKELKKIYMRVDVPPMLCFTANTSNSWVTLNRSGNPTGVNLEISTDGQNRSTYSIGTQIQLSNTGNCVYFRNKSETTTGFSTSSAYYYFSMGGSISASGDITYLLNKNGTTTISIAYSLRQLFTGCTSLTTSPEFPATTLANRCYNGMFNGCTNLESLPKLPATSIGEYCYTSMFYNCTKIKLSTTQTGGYQTPYRIPSEGTGTAGSNALYYMFGNTGGTFVGTPTINTTYYTSNEVV